MAKYTSTHTGQQIDNAIDAVSNKQDKLVSGTNIKTINNNSILGSGNLSISGGITEISTQYIRITDLASGVYKLTYNGTKYLYYYGTSSSTTHTVTGGAGAVVLVVSKYSTTYWHWWYINGTTSYATLYYGYTYSSSGSTGSKSINSLYTGTPTTPSYNQLYHSNSSYNNNSGYTVYAYQMLVFNGAGLSAFTSASSSTSTSKTQLSPKYYPNAPIFYYRSSSSVSTNYKFSGSYLQTVYSSIDLRYSFNISTSTLSAYLPVYIKMSINSDGSLSPHYNSSSSGHPLVQTLPSTEDGYVYVFLGTTGNTSYYLDLEPIHPCFWYKDGKILPYGGSGSSGSGGNVPAGGTAGQVLAKVDSTDYNTQWINASGGGGNLDVQVNGTSIVSNDVANILTQSTYSNSNKIATMNDLPSGEVDVTFNNNATDITVEPLNNIRVGETIYKNYLWYQHTIKFFKTYAGTYPTGCVYFSFLSQDETAVSTLSALLTALKNAGYNTKRIPASGYYYFSSSNTSKHILAVYPNQTSSNITAYYFDPSNWSEGSATLISASGSSYTITDSVIQLYTTIS